MPQWHTPTRLWLSKATWATLDISTPLYLKRAKCYLKRVKIRWRDWLTRERFGKEWKFIKTLVLVNYGIFVAILCVKIDTMGLFDVVVYYYMIIFTVMLIVIKHAA